MENNAEQLKSKFMATSRPTNLSSDFAHIHGDSHVLQPVISKEVISEAGEEKMFIVAKFCDSDAVKPKAGRGETHQRTDMDFKSNTYHGDGSTTTQGFLVDGHLVVANAGPPQGAISKAGKGSITADGMLMVSDSRGSPAVESNSDKGEPDSHGSIAVELISKDFKGGPYPRTDMGFLRFDGLTTKEAISLCNDLSVSPMSGKGITDSHGSQTERSKTGKITPCIGIDTSTGALVGFLDYESNTYRDDGPTKEAISGQPDSHGCQAAILKEAMSNAGKGEPDFHGAQAEILKEVISTDCKGKRTDMDSESNTSCYDGLATEKAISLCTEIFSQAVKPMSGEDGHLVGGNMVVEAVISKARKGETYVHYLDSESNTHQDDGSTASAATGGSKVLIPEGSQESEVQGSTMESLPSDIVQEILSRVPAESVLECKLVCKKWVTVIRGRNFPDMHLNQQLKLLHDGDEGDDKLAARVEPCLFFACRIDDPDDYKTLLYHGGQLSDKKYIYIQNVKRIYHPPMHNEPLWNHLVGSCNGLVCTFQKHHLVIDPIYICNPLTREYVRLPQLVVKKENADPDYICIEGEEVDMRNNTACGFGYLRSTNEYKVVRIHYLEFRVGNVEVYTLGSGCGWRAAGKISYRLDNGMKATGIYANDTIYWTSYNKVLAFDLAKEEFRLLPVPLCLQNRQSKDRCGLVALGRHLCLYMDKLHVEIWSLMRSSDTWRMEFDIDYEAVVGSREGKFKPILLGKNGEIIFLHDGSVLYCYDPKTTFLKIISDDPSDDYFEDVEVIAHANTFASLEALGENSKTYNASSPRDDVIDKLGQVALGEEIDTTRFRLR